MLPDCPLGAKSIILESGTVCVALAGIELRYLVNRISAEVRGYYVSNIYGIDRDSLLFKLHHTEKSDAFMVVSTSGVWLTSVRMEQMEENRLLKRLRSDLLRLRVEEVRQDGSERIAYLVFEGFGKKFILVGEFFGHGNILLCSDQMKILALQHSIDVRHRKLAVGLQYDPPPGGNLDPLDASKEDFAGLASTELAAAKWLGRSLGLPRRYVEGILALARIDPKARGCDLDDAARDRVAETAVRLIDDVVSGRHSPVIIRAGQTEALPVSMGAQGDECQRVEDFMSGLDAVFTERMLQRGKEIQSGASDGKIQVLRSQIAEQEKAIRTVLQRSEAMTDTANSLLGMVRQGITSIWDPRAEPILAGTGAKLRRSLGRHVMDVSDQAVGVNPDSPLQSIASVLFDEAKRQARAVPSINEALARTRSKMDRLQARSTSEKESVSASPIRKKSWYERYRWFFTSDGMLAVGGRDAASNSAVVRKQMSRDDIVFHAEIHGSPFFILKDAADLPEASMMEVAHATVCFSRAWREGMYGMSAYWVRPDQVKKSAPTGQFLPKGSFTIGGQRNFIKPRTLRLAVGVIPQNGGNVLACGPPDPVRERSVCYAVIEPHGAEMASAARSILNEFSQMSGNPARGIPVDDFVRVLPAGKSQIKEIKYGNAEPA